MDNTELNQALETQRFNRKRLELLKKPVIEKKAMVFAPGKNSFELRAIDMLQAMQPDERTQVLGKMMQAADYVSQKQNEDYDRVANG